MMSKNEMKANHNFLAQLVPMVNVGKYDVKERDESKSQPTRHEFAGRDSWQI